MSSIPSSSEGGAGRPHAPDATLPPAGIPREPGVCGGEATAATSAPRSLSDLGHMQVLPLPREAHCAAPGDLQPSHQAGWPPQDPQ